MMQAWADYLDEVVVSGKVMDAAKTVPPERGSSHQQITDDTG